MIAFARYAMVKFAALLRKTKYLPVRLRRNAFARSKLNPSLQGPRPPGMPFTNPLGYCEWPAVLRHEMAESGRRSQDDYKPVCGCIHRKKMWRPCAKVATHDPGSPSRHQATGGGGEGINLRRELRDQPSSRRPHHCNEHAPAHLF